MAYRFYFETYSGFIDYFTYDSFENISICRDEISKKPDVKKVSNIFEVDLDERSDDDES